MADEAHQAVDKMIEEMQKKISKEYKAAVETAQKRLDDHLAAYAKKDAEWAAKVKAGEATKKDWNKWRKDQMMTGKHWEQMKNALAQDYHNANVIARSIVTGYMPEAYATNFNWATYEVEKGLNIDTSFTLYNREAVERIAKEDPEILPPPGPTMQAKIAANKDLAWQQGQIQSVTLRSILTGESIDKIAKTISQELGAENFAAATRYARTAMTGAQNAGRQDAFERAESLGIDMLREWVATLDDKTRHEHRMLDGQRVGVNEPFEVDGEKIMYPGDPSAAGYLIWNCRCTVVSQLKGFERDINVENAKYLPNMTYEEWKKGKEPKEPKKQVIQAVQASTASPKAAPEPAKRFENDRLEKVLGDDYESFCNRVTGKETQPLYEKYIDDCSKIERTRNGGSYRPSTKAIEFDYTKDEGRDRYSTLAHEAGHHFDKMMGKADELTFEEADKINSILKLGNLGPVKDKVSQSDQFLSALRKDMDALKESVKDRSIRDTLMPDKAARNASAGIQDALDGFFGTQSSGLLPWGHGDRYYNRSYNRWVDSPDKRNALKNAYKEMGFGITTQAQSKNQFRHYEAASEAWANVCSAVTCGGAELEAVEKYMPNTLTAAKEIMGRVK